VGQTLFMAHSGFRYLVLLGGVIALLLAIVAVATSGSAAARRAAGVYRVYTVLLDIQVLLGIITAILRPFVPQYIGHIAMMLLAVAFAHIMAVKLRKAAEPKPMLALAGVLVSLALIVGGILAIGRPLV
jgi:hypothetical protein